MQVTLNSDYGKSSFNSHPLAGLQGDSGEDARGLQESQGPRPTPMPVVGTPGNQDIVWFDSTQVDGGPPTQLTSPVSSGQVSLVAQRSIRWSILHQVWLGVRRVPQRGQHFYLAMVLLDVGPDGLVPGALATQSADTLTLPDKFLARL